MSGGSARAGAVERVRLHDFHPPVGDLRTEVLETLGRRPRRIAPKFFYDEHGSRLFEAITRQPEYYPTRTELTLLQGIGPELRDLPGLEGDVTLVEFGSGASRKIRLLLDGLRPARYVPMDISRDFLQESADVLAADFPWVRVEAVCADYTQPLQLPAHLREGPLLGFFPGSSIGNFEPAAAARFLEHAHDLLGPGARFLVGVDLVKDEGLLHAAYNDAAGVTAAFNRNVLVHLNRRLGGDFDPEAFAHLAFWNPDRSRIEMHLRALRSQTVALAGTELRLRAGECLHTENSCKYTPDGFRALAERSGFVQEAFRTDDRSWFGLFLLRCA